MELIENIPYGLAACFLNGEQVTVTALSDRLLRVRLADEAAPETLSLRFLTVKTMRWTALTPQNWHEISRARTRCGTELLLAVDDPAYRAEVLRALGELAAFIRLKAEGDDTLAAALTGLDTGGTVSPTLAEQKQRWFCETGCTLDGDWTLALCLDRPDAYERFLTMPFQNFRRDFFAGSALDHHPLFGRPVSRLYIGNPCCPRLFPENIDALLDRCLVPGLKATIVLPPIRESRRAWLEDVLERVRNSPADEIAVNDWGTLTLVQTLPQAVLLGTQLNRRRKDPRMTRKIGFADNTGLLGKNSLNDADFAAFLKTMRVTRFEYEACPGSIAVAPGRLSLHLPFYQTNTSHACPLASACEGRDPGLPYAEETCDRPCLTRALLYPDELGLVGRYNSLFGCNREILSDAAALKSWLDQGIDRLVAELL